MKVPLFDFQEDALSDLQFKLKTARGSSSIDYPQAISFSAPTGSGKTVVMTALFENIFFGEADFEAQTNAVILWISDMPELNEQTRLKIESKSDRIRVRQLVTIDSNYDSERLADGNIFFINTQKLGSDKLLTRRGDSRQHTLWDTLTNTARAIPDRFYVVIDEAHRGMLRTDKEVRTAQTILQRFLLGSQEEGLSRMPLVIGMSATPHRFDNLLTGTTHTVHKVYVPTEAVRQSGLLKDRILIHYPESRTQSEMTLLAEAANRWRGLEKHWKNYCKHEGIEAVRPIIVIQVEDGTDKILTKTNLVTVLSTLEDAIGRQLREGELAHTFNDREEIEIGDSRVRRIDASRIEDDSKVNVVLFKMSLSTGWDCPRAEVMMSFRRAQDHTYIAQLLGRMVRTPLAHRIEKDATLNDVHLYLPHYEEETVDAIIKDLKNEEDVPPAETGTSRELVTLKRRKGTGNIFEGLQNLVTYRVDAVRKQSALRRLMAIGRGLTHDRIDEGAHKKVTQKLVKRMAMAVKRLRKSEDFDRSARQVAGIDLKTITLNGKIVGKDAPIYTIDVATADIDRHFEQAGRLLSNGLHKEYWKAYAKRKAENVKIEVIVLSLDHDCMQTLEHYAEQEFDRLYEEHKYKIAKLKEQRRAHYNNLRLATATSQHILWLLPETIPFRHTSKATVFEKHLYVEDSGTFRVDLGSWEIGVLKEELADPNVVAWLRNVDRQQWSLEIPYRDSGKVKPMFPDLLIVREGPDGFLFDILEPHDDSRIDNAVKAVGLAEFGEKHWHLFDRIQLIRKKKASDGKDHYYRLDVGKENVRKKVLAVNSNKELDQIFEKEARVR